MSQVYEAYRRPEDLGAPPSESATMVQLTVGGKTVTVPEGTKVTQLSDWRQEFEEFTETQLEFLRKARTPVSA